MSKAKKKAKSKAKAAPKKANHVDFRETRPKVKDSVGRKAVTVMDRLMDNMKNNPTPQAVKMVFELVGLFPETEQERAAQADDQSLAKVLLQRLFVDDDQEPINEEEARDKRDLEESAKKVMAMLGDPVK